MTRIGILLAGLILLVISSLALRAQTDWRISRDPLQPILPNDIRIQAADSIGDVTLVVWGSTQNSGGSVRRVLVAQLIRSGQPVAQPFVLSGAEDIPHDLVCVVSLGARFLVLWGDRRMRFPGTYCVVIDTLGTTGVQTQLADSTSLVRSSVVAKTNIPESIRLFWTGGTANIGWARNVSAAGTFLSPPYITGLPQIQHVLGPQKVSDTMYLDCGADGVILLDAHAAPHVIAGNSNEAISFSSTGSALVMRGDSVLVFSDPTQSHVLRHMRIILPDTIVRGTAFAFFGPRDSIHIAYCTIGSDGNHTVYVYIKVHDRVVDSAGRSGEDRVLGAFGIGIDTYPSPAQREYNIRAPHHICADLTELAITVATRWPGGASDTMTTTLTLLAPRSILFIDAPIPCPDQLNRLPVVRSVRDAAHSMVIVGDSGKGIVLQTPVALIRASVTNLTPAIGSADRGFLVCWRSNGSDTSLSLVRWDNAAVDSIERIAYASDTANGTVMQAVRATVFPESGGCFATLHTDSLRVPRSVPFMQQDRLLHATDSGWRQVYRIDTADGSTPNMIRSITFDPNRRTTFTMAGYADNAGLGVGTELIEFDSLDRPLWSMRGFPWFAVDHFNAVALAERDVIFQNRHAIYRFRDTGLVASMQFPGTLIGTDLRMARLLGPNFVEWYQLDGLHVDVFDTAIHRIRSLVLPSITDSIANLSIVQDPVDSGLAIVRADTDGVWLTLVDARLNVMEMNRGISNANSATAHPAAVFRHDSLAVVWEDMRDGNANIYGTVVAARTRAGVALDNRRVASYPLMHVYPNPCRSVATLRLAAPEESPLMVLVVNSVGMVVHHMLLASGAVELALDVSSLPAGLFFIRMQGRYAEVPTPLRIVR
ncbi:MAG: hypothetical protein JST22_13715 [Bacteroidetes bacterium]|nr:hypothetical protein [Bacteroidota bacterium]